MPELTSVPTRPSNRPKMTIPIALSSEPYDRSYQAQHHQRDVFARAKLERKIGQRWREQGEQDGGDRTGQE